MTVDWKNGPLSAKRLFGNYWACPLGGIYNFKTQKKMKTIFRKDGYESIGLCGKTYLVHALVAQAFIGKRRPGRYVNHKDGVKSNNTATNLEYVTPRQNHRHAIRTGLTTKYPSRKLTDKDVLQIKKLLKIRRQHIKFCPSNRELGNRFGVGHATIRAIEIGVIWDKFDEHTHRAKLICIEEITKNKGDQ